MKAVKLLINHMNGFKLLYMSAIISVGLATLFTTLGPLVVRITIDSIIGDQPLTVPPWIDDWISRLGGVEALANHLWAPGVLLIAITILRGLFLFLKGRWAAQASEGIATTLREKLYDHLQHLSYQYHVKAETGDLVQRCTSDVETIRRFLGMQLVEVGNAIFMLGFTISVMVSLSVPMTVVSMAVVPVIFAFAVIFFLKVKKAFQLSDEAEAAMTTVLQENLTGVRVVRAFANQAYEIDKFEEKNRTHRDLTYRLIWLLAWYWATSDLLSLLQIAAVVVVGAFFTAQGTITLGTLVVFTTYIGMLLWPVRQMGRILTDMGKALVAVERIQAVLDEKPEKLRENGKQPPIVGEVTFDSVHFSYEDNQPVLKNVSFHVRPGQTVGILGHTGSGKSSLIHLLARLYDYQSGSIKIDGVELRTIDKQWIRKHVGIVSQEPFLFAKTIKENIGLGAGEFDEDQLYQAAKDAAIHDVILKFDKGYDTLIGERGVSVSGGQRQRIAIARALLTNSPILVFDDSLSAVDSETDQAIRQALNKRAKNTTTFLISHRINSLQAADLIIVLEDGKIKQSGNHQELIAKPGLYQRVWLAQSGTEEESALNMAN